jgi:hypothetical protein
MMIVPPLRVSCTSQYYGRVLLPACMMITEFKYYLISAYALSKKNVRNGLTLEALLSPIRLLHSLLRVEEGLSFNTSNIYEHT